MSRRLFVTLLTLGALVRAAGLPSPGSSDVLEFRVWTYAAATLGPAQVYGAGNHWGPELTIVTYGDRGSTVQYPPLIMYVLAATGRAYQAVFPSFPDTPFLTAALKLPGVLASIALTVLLWRAVRKRYGDDAGRLAAAAYWANPAVILQGAFLGYLDSLVALPAIAALIAATEGSAAASGALLAAACLIKPQAIFVAPAVVLMLRSTEPGMWWRRLRNTAMSAAVVTLAIIWPVVRADAFVNMLFALQSMVTDGLLSGQAANLWWVVGYGISVAERAHSDGWLVALSERARILNISDLVEAVSSLAGRAVRLRTIRMTWIVLVAAVLSLMWRARHSADLVVAAALAALTVHLYFVLGVQVHENHLFLALPLLAVVMAGAAAYRRLFLVVSAISFLNLALFYDAGYGPESMLRDLVQGVDLTVVLALVNVAALVWHLRLFTSIIGGSLTAPKVTHGQAL